MSTTIDYKQTDLRTIDAVQAVRVYDVTTGEYVDKQVTRFQDKSGEAQDIKLHAYQYTANGKVQTVSMSQLFMTICMQRANEVELETVDLMAKMSENTTKINELSAIEDIYLNDTKSTVYNVWNKMDFGYYYYSTRSYAICELAEEIGLEVPDYIPKTSEDHKDISASDFENYTAFISQIIEENRTRLNEGGTGAMGEKFYTGLRYYFYAFGTYGQSYPSVFVQLFGNDASEFTTCNWYTKSGTMCPTTTSGGQLGINQKYQVGDRFFDTKEEVYAYAKDTYGIDMTQSQSAVTTAIENKLDGYNSISQEDMIELQSLVSKRDQSYTLVSNALKSMNNSNLAAANNF